jgi:hypothetical protein
MEGRGPSRPLFAHRHGRAALTEFLGLSCARKKSGIDGAMPSRRWPGEGHGGYPLRGWATALHFPLFKANPRARRSAPLRTASPPALPPGHSEQGCGARKAISPCSFRPAGVGCPRNPAARSAALGGAASAATQRPSNTSPRPSSARRDRRVSKKGECGPEGSRTCRRARRPPPSTNPQGFLMRLDLPGWPFAGR